MKRCQRNRCARSDAVISCSSENGSVMVLMAMLIVIMVMFAALAMDTAALAASKQEATHFAKYAALNALDAYTRTKGEHSAKMAAALNAANSIGGLNVTLLRPQSGALEEVNEDQIQHKPTLVPGRFYSEAPGECTVEDVCGLGKQTPCFVRMSDINTDCDGVENVGPNAFRVVGEYATGLRRLLGSVFSKEPMSLKVDEVAALVPRHGCFVIDISNSMFQETHNIQLPAPLASRHSFNLLQDMPPEDVGNNQPSDHEPIWNALDQNRSSPTKQPVPGSGDPDYQRKHYQSDYVVSGILTDSEYYSGNYDQHHPDPSAQVGITATPDSGAVWMSYARGNNVANQRTDNYRDQFYRGPEPISTIFDGMTRALEIFKERAVTGDRVCLILVDTYLIWPRVFNLTADFDYLIDHLDFRTPDTLRTGSKKSLVQMSRMGMQSAYRTFSNVRLGVVEALRQFREARKGGIPSVDFIVYAGDGLSNCTACQSNDDANCFPAGCGNDYYYYKQSIRELNDIAINALFPAKITFSAIITGDHVAPHTLNVASDEQPTICLTDEEARKKEIDFVSGGSCNSDESCAAAYTDMGAQNPFLRVNADMYALTRITGGVWGPLRKQSQGVCSTPTCSPSHPTLQTTSCLPPGEQMEEYIEKIMGSNPFMIVAH